MKHMMFTLCFLFPLICFSQPKSKYQELILPDDASPSVVKGEAFQQIVEGNCAYMGMELSWNEDLQKSNQDQCNLYKGYQTLSAEHLSWIDDVEMTTELDPKTGTEVEFITFKKDGQVVDASGFLSSRVEACKDIANDKSACIDYFLKLATEVTPLVTSSASIATNTGPLINNVKDQLESDLKELKGSRNPKDISKVKNLKSNLGSLPKYSENTGTLMPALAKSIKYDADKINGINKTLKRLEKGL